MTVRYVRLRPRAGRTHWLEDDALPSDWADSDRPSMEVWEAKGGAVDTGLLDADGVAIGRVTKIPIGFRLTRDAD